jgi:hypothetical protein
MTLGDRLSKTGAGVPRRRRNLARATKAIGDTACAVLLNRVHVDHRGLAHLFLGSAYDGRARLIQSALEDVLQTCIHRHHHSDGRQR